MNTGNWDPNTGAEANTSIDTPLLERMIAIIANGHGDNIASQLSADDLARHGIMRTPIDNWPPHLESLDQNQLLDLLRFFTLIEMQLPDWHAGDLSPVIAINRVLRGRNCKLDTEMLKWIRANSNNRFIPNGAAL